jgi:hypothetical protein
VSETLRWVALGAAGVVFLGCFAANVATLVRYIGSKRTGSMIPFLGGVVGSVGLALSPTAVPSDIWWLPLLIDPGSALLVVTALVRLVRRGAKDGGEPPS